MHLCMTSTEFAVQLELELLDQLAAHFKAQDAKAATRAAAVAVC